MTHDDENSQSKLIPPKLTVTIISNSNTKTFIMTVFSLYKKLQKKRAFLVKQRNIKDASLILEMTAIMISNTLHCIGLMAH